jgi:hypothetical protein
MNYSKKIKNEMGGIGTGMKKTFRNHAFNKEEYSKFHKSKSDFV